ncbi:Dyp-type peroxidase [Rubrimonas cliftonensis]|uniref:Dyp-type peroxidase family n=1 Tax=Rubrimonas cliftonensis TaxID=89524 RepID=A0A1H3XJ28_9RHOB|nr:Dyp-type peroxidase [Rubrimonas cliftonensis]SDZ98622.1 Dyp-type peroxidase family [Rubrimonas cliftonensis]
MASLDLADVQGNVARAYGRYSFPFARYFFLQITDGAAGRRFIEAIRPRVTTAAAWTVKPQVTLNVGFTFFGLWALGLPTRTLQGFPTEFADGMKARAFILGDRSPALTEEEARGWDEAWDPIWRDNAPGTSREVHVFLSMNAQGKPGRAEPVDALEEQTAWLREVCAEHCGGRVRIMAGHGRDGAADFQEGRAVFATLPDGAMVPTPREHFGFTDGIGDPVFKGQTSEAVERTRVVGRGKWMDPKTGWEPLATGEFLLGHADEAQELPPAPRPWGFSRNGAFMVWRKLHQNVASWESVWAGEAARYARIFGVSEDEAKVTLKSKAVGRWPDGVPLARAGDHAAWLAERARLGFDDPDPTTAAQNVARWLGGTEPSDFRYAADMAGYDCPNTAHLRRVNTRDYLDPLNAPSGGNPNATSQLNKRRRILRRGLPYGAEGGDDHTEQGVVFMAICASLQRQFEFIQQQWINYGLDFNAGNDACPVLGDHSVHRRFTIAARPGSGARPYIVDSLRTFVEARGGDYFFLPSLTALRMMGLGVIDPT